MGLGAESIHTESQWAIMQDYFYFYVLHINNMFCFLCFFFLPPHTASEILFPQPEIEPRPGQWKHRVLSPGPPGNFLSLCFFPQWLMTISHFHAHILPSVIFCVHNYANYEHIQFLFYSLYHCIFILKSWHPVVRIIFFF